MEWVKEWEDGWKEGSKQVKGETPGLKMSLENSELGWKDEKHLDRKDSLLDLI